MQILHNEGKLSPYDLIVLTDSHKDEIVSSFRLLFANRAKLAMPASSQRAMSANRQEVLRWWQLWATRLHIRGSARPRMDNVRLILVVQIETC